MIEDDVDEYLWDRSGPPDPEVRRLEGLLSRYRWRGRAAAPRKPSRLLSFRLGAAIAAGIAAAVLIVWAVRREDPSGYRLIGVEGRDLVRAGEEISTGPSQSARVEIGWLGHVDVEPNSQLKVEDCGRNAHRLFLSRGSVSARIWAQPRLFRIGTSAGDAIDLGCAYRLEVAPDGNVSTLRVTTGQVAFEFEGREIYVPAGAVCVSVQGRGPGAPVFEDSTPEFKATVAAAEFAPRCDAGLVQRVIDLAAREDTLTLWHLFTSQRTDPELRRAVYEKLSKVFPKPKGVDETGLFAGDESMCDAWKEEMKPAWR